MSDRSPDGVRNVRCVEAVASAKVLLVAHHVRKQIRETDPLEALQRERGSGACFGHCAAQTTGDDMLFQREYVAALARRGDDRICIEGLDSVDVDDPNGDVFI